MEICGYIIHFNDGSPAGMKKEKHIKEQIKNLNFPFKFMAKEPNSAEISANFKEGLVACKQASMSNYKNLKTLVNPIASCTFKHFESYRDMLKNNYKFAVIFENDIILDENFEDAVLKAIEEIKHENISNIFLSLEDSYFRFVPGSRRVKGKTVYKMDGKNTRCAAAYLIDFIGGKNLIDEVDKNKCGCVIDHFHTNCAAQKIIDIYYLHPTIATQGSRGGTFASTFTERKLWYPLFIRRLSYKLQRQYKKLLWRLR